MYRFLDSKEKRLIFSFQYLIDFGRVKMTESESGYDEIVRRRIMVWVPK